jgi:hypothetical protein
MWLRRRLILTGVSLFIAAIAAVASFSTYVAVTESNPR